jgi:hypothetical protein
MLDVHTTAACSKKDRTKVTWQPPTLPRAAESAAAHAPPVTDGQHTCRVTYSNTPYSSARFSFHSSCLLRSAAASSGSACSSASCTANQNLLTKLDTAAM